MDAYKTINDILVNLINEIWRLEEKAIITEEFKDISNNDMHVIEAIGLGEGNNMSAIAKKLNVIMTELYSEVQDVQFMIMGIGDLAYDSAPIQASQFESDIRIAEQLDKLWFERGGGGNMFESYTAAWYFGLKHTELDCWKRGKKGIIITLGDETLNPYLPKRGLQNSLGDSLEADVETDTLYQAVTEKFDVYHLAVDDRANSYRYYAKDINETFSEYFDDNRFRVVTLDSVVPQIVSIVTECATGNAQTVNSDTGISW